MVLSKHVDMGGKLQGTLKSKAYFHVLDISHTSCLSAFKKNVLGMFSYQLSCNNVPV